jgi:hypothetical protein
MADTFVGEDIQPVPGTADTAMMARGQPGVPRRFHWREREYVVKRVADEARRMGECSHGSDEQYVRKHVYTVETECGRVMKLSCDRSPRPGSKGAIRWRLVSMDEEGNAGEYDQ